MLGTANDATSPCSASRRSLGGRRFEVVDDDEGADLLTEVGMRDTDNGGVHHAVNREERPLDSRRGDVLAAADDQVLRPSGDPETTVLIEMAEVAGVQPSFRVDRLFDIAGIAGHLCR